MMRVWVWWCKKPNEAQQLVVRKLPLRLKLDTLLPLCSPLCWDLLAKE